MVCYKGNDSLFDWFAVLLVYCSTGVSKPFFEKTNQLFITGAFPFFCASIYSYCDIYIVEYDFRELQIW